ncbi:MAG: fused signal recognition particle receptor, partial [Chthoniobacter sp.]|nr:fused signal recognition particle receptor [Chthoniobacter sp.]
MAIGFFKSIIQKFAAKPVDWDELEETLIRADLGVPMTLKILASLRARADEITAKDVIEVTREKVSEILPFDQPPMRPLPSSPKVVMVVGVNGTGKTTSTAKLAHLLKSRRHSVMLCAADTFRAAAIEQLAVWAERADVEMIKGQYNADPASLCYDAYVAAEKKNIEFLLCDTAGRLHTKINLMSELEKIKRTLRKHDNAAPHE